MNIVWDDEQKFTPQNISWDDEKPKLPSASQVAFPGTPLIKPIQALLGGYDKAFRQPVSKLVGSLVPEGGEKYQMSLPNPLLPPMPIPAGKFTARESAEELGGIAADELATAGIVGTSRTLLRGIPKLARGLADIPTKSIKRLREIGPKNVFKPELESPDFIGKELVPKVASNIESQLSNMSPVALRKIGVKPDIIEQVGKIKKEYSIDKLPTEKEADDFFHRVMDQSVFDRGVETNNFKKALVSAINNVESGVGKDDRLAKGLRDMLNDPKMTSNLSKKDFIGTRRNLNNLISGNPEFDRFIYDVKDALDSDAAQSGITGIKKASALYKVSRDLEKVQTYLNNPKRFQGIESELSSAMNPKKSQIRELLKGLLGKEYPVIEQSLESHRIAQEFSPKGLYASRGGIIKGSARAGLKAYEEKIRPTLKSLLGRKRG